MRKGMECNFIYLALINKTNKFMSKWVRENDEFNEDSLSEFIVWKEEPVSLRMWLNFIQTTSLV